MSSSRTPLAALAAAAAAATVALLATPATADAMAPAIAPMMADDAGCFGNSIIGIALEGSAAVCEEFPAAISGIADFIDATSGVDSGDGANGNLYYVNTFSTFTTFTTGDTFESNAERAVSDEVDMTFSCAGGTVNVAGAVGDLTTAFNDLGAGRGIAFVILASFPDAGNPIVDAIRSLRVRGVVVIAIAVGDGTSMPALMDIADEDASGAELIFSSPTFADLGNTLITAFSTVDVDNDGVAECQDGCPTDSLKIEPERCGCGLIDSFDGDCISFGDFFV